MDETAVLEAVETPAVVEAVAEADTEADTEAAVDPAVDPAVVEEDLLVEDVSIDGMCGVY